MVIQYLAGLLVFYTAGSVTVAPTHTLAGFLAPRAPGDVHTVNVPVQAVRAGAKKRPGINNVIPGR